jgi:hypothetical protein
MGMGATNSKMASQSFHGDYRRDYYDPFCHRPCPRGRLKLKTDN